MKGILATLHYSGSFHALTSSRVRGGGQGAGEGKAQKVQEAAALLTQVP